MRFYPSHQFQSSKSVALNVYEGFALVAMKFVVFIQSLPEWDRNLGLPKKVKRKHCVMFFSKLSMLTTTQSIVSTMYVRDFLLPKLVMH